MWQIIWNCMLFFTFHPSHFFFYGDFIPDLLTISCLCSVMRHTEGELRPCVHAAAAGLPKCLPAMRKCKTKSNKLPLLEWIPAMPLSERLSNVNQTMTYYITADIFWTRSTAVLRYSSWGPEITTYAKKILFFCQHIFKFAIFNNLQAICSEVFCNIDHQSIKWWGTKQTWICW